VKALGDLAPGAFFMPRTQFGEQHVITHARLADMSALEILTAWREDRLDPSVRIVSVNGDLDNPRSLTYAWSQTEEEFTLSAKSW
jgi:hypothetical protein